jgi:branched-chain amino acid transport system substrate-binding protein
VRKQRLVIAGVSLLAATMAMSACGSRSESPSGGGGSAAADKTVKIGVIVPLTGDNSLPGLGIKNGVDLAIKEANQKKTIPGWTIQIDAQDDQATPDVGKNAATQLAADDEVAAVVGTLNSGVAQQVQPILNSAHIAEISPANTNPTLTQGAKWQTAPARPYPNYFRTVTTDAIQGPFAAKYLYSTGIKKVATINDKQTYGQGLVGTFTEAYKAAGGTITSAETINVGETKFNTVISRVQGGKPQAVYYGGQYAEAGPLSAQMKQAGLNIPLMGGDGIYTSDYLQKAGKAGTGDLATSVGAPTESLPSAKAFVAAYKAAGYKEEYGAYGAYAYDATNAIITSLKASLEGASDVESARQKTIDEIGKVSLDGVTGNLAFDQYGDTKIKVLTVYKDESAKWVPVKTGS